VRERRNVSLAEVAESTKIKQSLLASLERGDASQWPAGIYRRGFLREYAQAIGAVPEAVVAEFLRLFPEPGADNRIDPADGSGALRLTMVAEPRWFTRTTAVQCAAALIDSGFVLAAGRAIANPLGALVWTTTALVAVAYYALGTAWLGHSPMLWVMNAAILHQSDAAKTPVRARPSSRDVLHIVTTAPRHADLPVEQDEEIETARTASR